MRNNTYNLIVEYLKTFADSHLDVERFAEDNEDMISSVTSMGESFPMIFVTPIFGQFNYDLNYYSFRVYCYDRTTKDRKNITNIRSKTYQILNDLDVWLRKEHTLPFELEQTSSVYPMLDSLMTDVTGWYMDIEINNPSFSVCDIPFETPPNLPLGVCNE